MTTFNPEFAAPKKTACNTTTYDPFSGIPHAPRSSPKLTKPKPKQNSEDDEEEERGHGDGDERSHGHGDDAAHRTENMTTLSSRKVSLSDHVKRRRSSALLSSMGGGGGSAGGGSSGSGGSGGSSGSGDGARRSSRRRHHPDGPTSRSRDAPAAVASARDRAEGGYEGGYDSHAASYGNYDAPSQHCRSYGASEHGCYASERYIGGGFSHRPPPTGGEAGGRRRREGGERRCVNPLKSNFSDNEIDSDLECQRHEVGHCDRRRGRPRRGDLPDHSCPDRLRQRPDNPLRLSQASTARMGPQAPSWEEESAASYYSSNCPSAATASTANSSRSNLSVASGATAAREEDAIRQGIIDASTLIATYVAGALSFVVGIFLALLSPIIKVIKVVAGDVRGLLGDAAFLRELGSLWRMYRELRRRSRGSASEAADRPDHDHRRDASHYDDESLDASRSHRSAQYVGGWRPNAGASVGSGASRSYASMPEEHEDRRRYDRDRRFREHRPPQARRDVEDSPPCHPRHPPPPNAYYGRGGYRQPAPSPRIPAREQALPTRHYERSRSHMPLSPMKKSRTMSNVV
ncbi:hypothetical protein ACHAWF_012306 [Thalassiosira exigua]